jgi:predicted esterase
MPESRTVTRVVPAQAVGRYLVEDRPGPLPLLVGFHGYGENAEIHLEQLRRLRGAARFRLASVQALHRFYKTKTGEVVASWMTKQDREQAIAHNIAYVARVVEEIEQEHGKAKHLVYAGFSQGAAMAYRAAARSAHRGHGIVVLGGDVPPDIAEDASAVLPPVFIGRGTEDPWYTEEKMARDLEALRARGTRVETLVFAGGHEWTPAFLEGAGTFLEGI